MKSQAGQPLDPTSIEVLTDIMNAASSALDGVDAYIIERGMRIG